MSRSIGLSTNMEKIHLMKIVGIRQRTIHRSSYRRGWGRGLFQSIYESQWVTVQNKLLYHQVPRKVQTEFNSLGFNFHSSEGCLDFLATRSYNPTSWVSNYHANSMIFPSDFWCIKTEPSTLTLNWLAWGGLQWACVIGLGPFSTWTLSWYSIRYSIAPQNHLLTRLLRTSTPSLISIHPNNPCYHDDFFKSILIPFCLHCTIPNHIHEGAKMKPRPNWKKTLYFLFFYFF